MGHEVGSSQEDQGKGKRGKYTRFQFSILMGKLYQYVLDVAAKGLNNFAKFHSGATQSERDIDNLNRKMGTMNQNGKTLGNTFGGLKRILVTAFAVTTIFNFGQEVLATTAKAQGLRNAIVFASGSAAEGNKNLDFLADTSNRLGLSLEASQSGFKTLSAAMMGSRLVGKATRDIYEGVSIGAAAMGLTAEQSEGAFLALGQMMGKGKVQAEELRGQLGERIPGAFQIAARAMGVTTKQLDKMMQSGDLIAEEFLPKFAAEMKRTFSPALGDSVNSLQANMNRFNNEIYLTKDFLGTAMIPIVTQFMSVMNDGFQFLRNNMDSLKKVFAPLKSLFTPLINVIDNLMYKFSYASNEIGYLPFVFNKIGNALAFMEPLLSSAGNLFGTVFEKVVGISNALAGNSMFQKWAKAFIDTLAHIGGVAKDIIGGIGDMMIGLLEGKMSTFKSGAKSLGSGLLGALSIPFQPAKSLMSDLPEEKSFFSNDNKAAGLSDGFLGGKKPPGSSGGGDSSVAKNGIEGVAGGGSKGVNINFEKVWLAEKIEINSGSVAESAEKIEEILRQLLGRILNGGRYAATQ